MKKIVVCKPEKVGIGGLVELARKNPKIVKAGAIASFLGIVRGESKGKKVRKLFFEAHEKLAEKALKKIVRDMKKKKGVVDVLIRHHVGEIKPAQDILLVVVAAAHRKEAFAVLKETVERVKKEAPIWKKEYLKNSSRWVINK